MEKEKLYIIIESIPLLLALFFAITFYLKREKSKSNKYLSALFLVFIAIQCFTIFINFLDDQQGKLLIPLVVGGALMLPPIIFVYVNSLILKGKDINNKKHFALGTIFFTLNVIAFSIINVSNPNSILAEYIGYSLTFITLGPLYIIFPIQCIYYIIISFAAIKKHQKDIGEIYSYIEGINLQWVKLFLAGFIGFFILATFDHIFGQLIEDNESFFRKISYDLLTLIYVGFIGIKALQQTLINNALTHSQISIKDEIEEEDKSIIENEIEQTKFKEIKLRLEECMSANQPYVDTSLSIYDLAKMIETNYKYLSKTINQEFNQNFVSYINTYRVEESMHLLKTSEYDNYTIEALAEMSGFKSKSAFNTAFKKQVGQTPSEFKNS